MLNIYNANQHTDSTNKAPGASSAAQAGPTNGTPKPKPSRAFDRYTDPAGDVSNQTLKYGFWYMQRRLLLYKIIIGALIVVSIALWGFSLFAWGNYAIFGWSADQRLHQDLRQSVDYTTSHSGRGPKQIEVLGSESFVNGISYNAMAEVANTNDRWLARVSYHFDNGSGTTTPYTATLLPGENRPLVAFGVPDAGANLAIDEVRWERINPHDIANPVEWQAERLRFTVGEVKFFPADPLEGSPAQRIEFAVTNESSYGYKRAPFIVALLFQDAVVGVLPLEIDRFAATETRTVELSSFAPSLTVNDVRLYPLINVYDPEVFLKPQP